MNKVVILTDSTCDLDLNIIQEKNINVIPLYVCFGDKNYKDGVDINTEKLYEMVEELGYLPKTSAVSPNEFINFFTPFIDKGYDIVYLGIGSTLSSTFNNAYIASLSFPENRIFLIDSLNLSTGTGLLVLKACKYRDQNFSAAEIQKKVTELVPRVHSQFSVKKLDFLHKGGRCSGTKKFFGTMLRIRPIIRVKQGVLLLDDKVYGRFEKALDLMIKDLNDHKDDLDEDVVMVTHSLGDEECKYIMERIPEDIKKRVHLLETHAGCVISSHCGRKTIGILYITNH